MKNTPSILPVHSGLYLILIVSIISLCACTVTRTTDPYIPGEKPKFTKTERPQKKETTGRFYKNKKLEDAFTDFKKDNRGGRLKLKQYGAPGPVTPYYNKLLTEELGITVEVIADGLVSADVLRYAKQYNALMTTEIQRKYGPGILQEARRRAQIMLAQVERSSLQ